MSGDTSGTDGGRPGTSGERLPWRRFPMLWLCLAAFLVFVCTVNVSSILIEDPPGERGFHVWEPVLWEGSSVVAILALFPLIWGAYWRLHWRRRPLWQSLAIHAVISVLFSLAHIGIMVAIRMAGYALDGARYDFAQGDLGLQLIYEMRKDAISYIVLFGACWVQDRLMTRVAPPSTPGRLEVKADGRTFYLDPVEVLAVEAAGNYVEFHRLGVDKALLVRGTLNQFEAQLKPHGFVRVHRSKLINRSRIAGFEGTPSGDLRIRMTDGREIFGSRRYRENLESKAAGVRG
jgi:DNA-binding LytR/AlgR family response regulator